MDVTTPRALGRTGLRVTPLGFGAAPIGRPSVTDEVGLATVREAWDRGVRFFDTAPWYGIGRSERRLGLALGALGARDEFLLNTKVGRWLVPEPAPDAGRETRAPGGDPRTPRDRRTGFRIAFEYTYDAIHAQHYDSRQRLGLAAVDSLTIHDLDRGYHDADQMAVHLGELSREGGGGARALEELRASGAIGAIGIGCNLETRNAHSWLDDSHEDLYERLVDMVEIDFVIVAGGYTLLEQRALRRLLPLLERRGIGVVIASPYAGGWLAAPGEEGYMYAPAPPEVVERSGHVQATCEAHGVPMAAAALQFPLAHPAVATIIPGAKSPAEAAENADRLAVPIPPALWADLKAQSLLDPAAPTPGEAS